MRVLLSILLGIFPLLTSANEQALTDYADRYNDIPGQHMLLSNIRNHANLWSGWIDKVEGQKQSWGTFTALVDDGEVTFWHTDENSSWLSGTMDGAEAGQAADTLVSAVLLSSVSGAVEMNPLGLPMATVLKYATNQWAEKQDFNTCRDAKGNAGRLGWAATGWNLASLINPVLGVVAAVSMYNKGGELTDDTIGRSCQGWIGPVVIDKITTGDELAQSEQAQEEAGLYMDHLMTANY